MKSYSHVFSTLPDEQEPVGLLGRGTHYSILRALIWGHEPRFHDFAVIWDDDHDERIVWCAEQLLLNRLLGEALVVGERKGNLTILTHSYPSDDYNAKVNEVATRIPGGDSFDPRVWPFPHTMEPHFADDNPCTEGLRSIVYDEPPQVAAYLAGINALWRLGPKQVSDFIRPSPAR